MVLFATSTAGWICGCTQSASLPASSSVARAHTVNVHSVATTATPARQIARAPLPVQYASQQVVAVPSMSMVGHSPSPNNIIQTWRRKEVANPWKTSAKARAWQHIVLHHTAVEQGSVESIHEAHLQRRDSNGNPWLGIGYHFVIGNGRGMKDGAIEPTFRWRQQMHGAHAGNAKYNNFGIGICLVGNFENHPPTPKQLASVRQLILQLRTAYNIKPTNIVGHGDVKKTACPGRYFSIAKVTHGSPVLQFGDFSSPKSTGVTLVAQEQYAQ